MDLYFLKYNNYYNHTYKKENLLVDYLPYRVAEVEDCELWNPGDGIRTSQVLDYDPVKEFPDYMVVAEGTEIYSRWFVIDGDRLRNGQYRVSLLRDVIADNIEAILTSPMFVERALLQENDNLIFNSENITVNQIKTSETLIKDNTGVPWIVGYLNRSVASKAITGSLDITANKIVNNLSDWEYYQYIDNYYNGYTADDANWFALYWCQDKNGPAALNLRNVYSWDIHPDQLTYNGLIYTTAFDKPVGYTRSGGAAGPSTAEVKSAFQSNTWIQQIRDRFNIHSADDTKAFALLDGKYILQVGSTFYRVHLKSDSAVYEETINNTEATELPIIDNICKNTLDGIIIPNMPTYNLYTIHSSGIKYKVELEELSTDKGFSTTIPADRPHLNDAPYDMFCMPYGIYNNLGSKEFYMKVATAISTTFNVGSTSELYDLQLLPFAPKLSDTTTDIKNAAEKVIGKIYWATESSFSKTILLDQPIGVENKKIDNICNKYRLVSPNYSGQFEFTAAANNGISGFKVDCTYMPINPYIRVAPLFGGLYGKEFNDARGLICGGDFSLPVVNSAWVSYQQNNKNYQAIFDRQIQNLEFTNDINRKMDRINAITGTVSGATSGAMAGSMAGPWGAAIGGAVGGIASGAAGVADITINESIRQENMSYTKDRFTLSLGNIQAQPYSLSKTTAFTANNKIFPILEYYTCSEREKLAVASQIAQYSMNVGIIGTLQEFLSNSWSYRDIQARKYIRGVFTQIKGINDDFHLLNTINQELSRGIYFDEYTE